VEVSTNTPPGVPASQVVGVGQHASPTGHGHAVPALLLQVDEDRPRTWMSITPVDETRWRRYLSAAGGRMERLNPPGNDPS
jgi:hypothetical protein